MSRVIKFAPQLRELRIHLCQNGETSKGVRDFISNHYISLKQNNPSCPILVRECMGVQPRLWARYDGGRENSVVLANLKAEDVLRQVELLTVKG
ncbi:UNVERIFIED_CONTAM: hypothetical protein PYX00_002573 [Menopon gallinae]|uniref:NADH dehydrogenase [ubiquinone] 1 alpha subcomplex subunit 2 n=1 Tax=Menopon gallinae TaxID=328185 RepID=A0AAW2IIN0_9NEOP